VSFLERFTERLTSLEASAGESYDHEVVRHQHRVAAVTDDFMRALGLPADQRADARLAGRFHDIGKLRIPQQVLLKPSALDQDERALIEEHGRLGAELLSEHRLELPEGFADTVRYHHERWDGLGYERIGGTDIPYASRLLSIVDVFDALTAHRVYRPAMTEAQALRQMVSQSDGVAATWFDPQLFRQFLDWRCEVSGTLTAAEKSTLRG
jgi:putative two-component system response regulator